MDKQSNDNRRKVTFRAALKHIGTRRLAAMLLSIVVAVCAVLAISFPLYNSAKEGVELRGEYANAQASEALEQYLVTGRNALLLSGFVVDKMIQLGASSEEILSYISEESERTVETLDEDFRGLYGWLDGEYLTSTGFVPDSTFHAKQRPWYIRAMKGKGNLVYVDPYLDANTGSMVMTLAKRLSDGESVIALDIALDEMQRIVDRAAVELENGDEMVLDQSGGVVAHSSREEIGHNYRKETGTLGKLIADTVYNGNVTRAEISFDGKTYVLYNSRNEGGWHSVSLLSASEFYYSLNWMVVGCCLLVVLIIVAIFIIFIRVSMRNIIAKNLNLQISAIADIYSSVIDINLPEDSFTEIINRENLEGVMVHSFEQAQASLYAAVDKLANKAFRPVLKEFLDLSTLSDRLEDRTNISLEFQDTLKGWCRGRLIVAERDQKGKVVRVLWAIESVDEERRRRDELIRLAETDQMTGIFNRASGEHKTQEELSHGKGGMFMMLDIDHFKSINDCFGHSVGDQVIIQVANCLRKAFRNGDIVMRLGGDEFAAYAPGVTSHTISERILERFFRSLAQASVPEMNNKPIHVSVGIAFCPEDSGMDFHEIYELADQGVYQSK